jgi:hypothetical protein
MRRRRLVEQDLERDIQEHIDFETADNIARGMSPEEARYAAIRKFGNIARVKEDTATVWAWVWLETLGSDVKHALRRIRRTPGTAALAALSLAIAFAPSVALLSVMDRLFLSPVPFKDPGEILAIQFRDTRPAATISHPQVSYPEFRDFRDSLRSFSGLAYQRRQGVLLALNGRSVLGWANLVSDSYFDVLGIPVRFGPGFAHQPAGVVISHGLWIREFSGSPAIIGQPLVISGQSFTIAGVGAPDFRGHSDDRLR